MLIAISIYQYVMSTFATLLLIIIPVIGSRQYFDSLFVDIFARCVLWLYFVGSYWSIARAIRNGFSKKKNPFFVTRKSAVTFVLLSISAIITGGFLSILTNWSLTAFVPQLPNILIFIVSVGNGMIYGSLIILQYYFLSR